MSTDEMTLVVAAVSAALSLVAVTLGLVVRQRAHRASADAEMARTSAGDADRSARFAAGRAKAMGEYRPMVEAVLVEWGLRPERARVVVRELREQVGAEVAAQRRAGTGHSMTAERAEGFRVPRDGGPNGPAAPASPPAAPAPPTRPSGPDGPSGTRRQAPR